MSNSFTQTITKHIETGLSQLQAQLIEAGLDEEKVNRVFVNFSGPQVNSNDVPVKNIQRKRVKRPQDEKVHIVLNYGSSHAVFGDFGGSLRRIKDDYFNKLNWIKYNGVLAYGKGWNLTKKEKLSDLESIFKQEGVEYVKMDREEFDRVYRKAVGEETVSPENSDSEDEGPSKRSEDSDPETVEEEPRSPKKRTVGRLNFWGNRTEKETGIIFHQVLPKKWVAIGTQDKKAKKLSKKALTKIKSETKSSHVSSDLGLTSVIRLTPEEATTCEAYLWEYLSQETIEEVTKKSSEKAQLLQKILDQNSTSGEFLCLLCIPYEDKEGKEDSLEVPVQFESRKHFDMLEGDMFDMLGDQFNDYLSQYEGELHYSGGVEVIEDLEELPKDEDGEPMEPLVIKKE